MPTYGLKYQSQFTSQSDANNPERLYTLQFLFKGYVGGVISVPGGETTVIQKCTVDDPQAAIKGQSLDIMLLNKNKSLAITSFYSDDDDGVQVKLLDENNNILFIGFVVQDDCYEPLIDYTHPIQLSANDSLGLLKGVILSDASVKRGFIGEWVSDTDTTRIHVNGPNPAFYPEIGDILQIAGIDYTVVSTVYGQHTYLTHVYNWIIEVTPDTGGIAHDVGTFYLTYTLNLINRNSLLDVIAVCLYQTQLPLLLNIFHNVFETRMGTGVSMFEQAIIDTQLFINGETYDNCYDVLSRVLTTFRCSLFQANGQWNIVHWDELRRYNNAIPGYIYDESFLFIGTTVFNNTFNIGPDPQVTRPISELSGGINRADKFVRKEFDYVFPKYLLRNYDLLQLGDLIQTYQAFGNTVSEYHAIGWEDGSGTPLYVNRFIRVIVENASGAETSRCLVLKGDTGVSSLSKSVVAKPIEVNAGDKIKFSFSVRGVNSFSGTWVLQYAVMLTDGTISKYVDDLPVDDGAWIPTIGFAYSGSGTDTIDWHNVTITSSPAPYTGLLYCYLTQMYSNGDETLYKDLRFEYIPSISDSTKVIGHIHKDNRPLATIKNNSDVKIEIDDSPRNAIAGTLFLPTVTSLLQDRTTTWEYKGDFNGYKLGQLTAREELWLRSRSRTRVEGGYIGLKQSAIISLLSAAIFDWDTNRNYVPGLMSIDYKRNRFSCTLYEIWDVTEPEFTSDYTFKYIYSTT